MKKKTSGNNQNKKEKKKLGAKYVAWARLKQPSYMYGPKKRLCWMRAYA